LASGDPSERGGTSRRPTSLIALSFDLERIHASIPRRFTKTVSVR